MQKQGDHMRLHTQHSDFKASAKHWYLGGGGLQIRIKFQFTGKFRSKRPCNEKTVDPKT